MKNLIYSCREYAADVWLKVFLFFLNPTAGLLYSLIRPYTKSSQILFFLFGLIFAMSINIAFDLTFDIRAYQKKFNEAVDFVNSGEGLTVFLTGQNIKDLYIWAVGYCVALFTENYRVFFLVLAIPFSGFAIASFGKFLKVRSTEALLVFYILISMFFTNHYFGINGARFWTAAWIGIFLSIKIFYEEKYRWLILIVLLPIIHGSFYFYLIIILLSVCCIKYRLYGRRLLYLGFGASFILQIFSLSLLQSVAGKLGFINEFYTTAYLSNESFESFSEHRGDYSSLGNIFRVLMKYYTLLLYAILLYNYKAIINTPSRNLFVFLSIWVMFANVTMFIPSLGERNLKMLLPIIAFIYMANYSIIKARKIIYLFPVIYFFEAYLSGLRYMTVLDKSFFVNNILITIDKSLQIF